MLDMAQLTIGAEAGWFSSSWSHVIGGIPFGDQQVGVQRVGCRLGSV